MSKIVVLGASGMLGSMLIDYLARTRAFDLVGTVRSESDLSPLRQRYPAVGFRFLDVESCSEADLIDATMGASWVVNAVGLIKQRIVDNDAVLVERAIRVNSLFSFMLARTANEMGFRLVQVATDCVYSGATGRYAESSSHDCSDVYGRTKSLGEVHSRSVHNLRCSIIGPEPRSNVSLLNWFLSQPRNAAINGYVNHHWNGITTLQFAKIVTGLIQGSVLISNFHHIVPEGDVTKDGLLRLFAKAYDRGDLTINSIEASEAVDRRLITESPDFNRQLWRAAGYPRVPGIQEMVWELAEYQRRMRTDNLQNKLMSSEI